MCVTDEEEPISFYMPVMTKIGLRHDLTSVNDNKPLSRATFGQTASPIVVFMCGWRHVLQVSDWSMKRWTLMLKLFEKTIDFIPPTCTLSVPCWPILAGQGSPPRMTAP